MMRSILIPVADRPECAVALHVAFQLSKRLSANVTGLHVRPHRHESKTKAKPKGLRFGWPKLTDFDALLTDEKVAMNSRAAEKIFLSLAEENALKVASNFKRQALGGQAVWKSMAGGIQPVFSIFGPLADLIVVSRPRGASSNKGRAFMMAALLCSGRPVLMLPHSRRSVPGKRVLIAWNQSQEAAAAVHASMSLIRTADNVEIFVAGPERGVGPKATAMQQYLRQWNVKSKVVRTAGADVDAELLDAYKQSKSDLVIMGAYSRPHWREMIFGGATDFVLHKTAIPVLLMHK